MPLINAQTQVCGILGHPVRHSLSPAIHNAAFRELDLDFVYVAHDVTQQDLRSAIHGARAMGYRGLSVTIPHKIPALYCVDEADDVAAGIGCINTIVNVGGLLHGYNSDGRGALGALKNAGANPEGKRVVVLGSGGAARAIAMTVAMEAPPASLRILGVLPDELANLVKDIRARSRCAVDGVAFSPDALATTLADADLLLQTTPVGMHPKEAESLVPPQLMRPDLVVFDAVYTPRRTRLLVDAAAAGATVVEGLEMFLGQAVVQFELWTGRPAPVSVMRAVLEEKLPR
jgi:shikimate dehydrogenase